MFGVWEQAEVVLRGNLKSHMWEDLVKNDLRICKIYKTSHCLPCGATSRSGKEVDIYSRDLYLRPIRL